MFWYSLVKNDSSFLPRRVLASPAELEDDKPGTKDFALSKRLAGVEGVASGLTFDTTFLTVSAIPPALEEPGSHDEDLPPNRFET